MYKSTSLFCTQNILLKVNKNKKVPEPTAPTSCHQEGEPGTDGPLSSTEKKKVLRHGSSSKIPLKHICMLLL